MTYVLSRACICNCCHIVRSVMLRLTSRDYACFSDARRRLIISRTTSGILQYRRCMGILSSRHPFVSCSWEDHEPSVLVQHLSLLVLPRLFRPQVLFFARTPKENPLVTARSLPYTRSRCLHTCPFPRHGHRSIIPASRKRSTYTSCSITALCSRCPRLFVCVGSRTRSEKKHHVAFMQKSNPYWLNLFPVQVSKHDLQPIDHKLTFLSCTTLNVICFPNSNKS